MEAHIETHDCHWKAEALKLQAENAQLKRMMFGKRSEKMPRIKPRGSSPCADAIQQNRRERKSERDKLPEVVQIHTVEEKEKNCPRCGSTDFKQVGEGRQSVLYEWIPARLERQVHIQETWSCSCGEHMITAKGPKRPVEGGSYGAGFIAHIVTAKCCDSIPLYRIEKQLKRSGLPLSRSTLCNLFHQAASTLEPIFERMCQLLPSYSLVLADETPIPVQAKKKTHKGYIWAFINNHFILYRYSDSRSGITAKHVLKDSSGTLLADGFAGYNQVCDSDGRVRAGCWAHVRRKFFEASVNAEEAQHVLDIIGELYQIEYDAKTKELVKSEHIKMRCEKSKPLLDQLKSWLIQQQTIHPPQSAMGKAVNYTLKQWAELNQFVKDAALPLDNNASERALRIVAIGRKNYLFAGNERAAKNLAGLYSLVASCELHAINPQEYLTDVLNRVHTHPQKEIDDLLPHRWIHRLAH